MQKKVARRIQVTLLAVLAMLTAPGGASAEKGFGIKIFRVESGLYPYVQIYFRTFDDDMYPLVNLNEMNIGIMVKGRSYDPQKGQYRIASIRDRDEAVRSVLVIDSSASMSSACKDVIESANRFIDLKRKQDQVAIIAISDSKDGYDVISDFERDGSRLGKKLVDVKCTAKASRLYDAVAAGLKMCGASSQGKAASGQTDYIVSNSVVVFSDGKDDKSAVTLDQLNTRISSLPIPVPIYAVGVSSNTQSFGNLESLSKNSFGKHFMFGESRLSKVVEEIQDIQQSDYVVMVRSYAPVDGNRYKVKLGIEYPSRSGKFAVDEAEFETLEPPPLGAVKEKLAQMEKIIPARADNNPFLESAPPAQ